MRYIKIENPKIEPYEGEGEHDWTSFSRLREVNIGDKWFVRNTISYPPHFISSAQKDDLISKLDVKLSSEKKRDEVKASFFSSERESKIDDNTRSSGNAVFSPNYSIYKNINKKPLPVL